MGDNIEAVPHVSKSFTRKALQNHLKHFVGEIATMLSIHTERLEVGDLMTDTQTNNYSAFAHPIQHEDFFGQAHRVMQRSCENCSTESQAPCCLQDCCPDDVW
jgi:hypothetical protein